MTAIPLPSVAQSPAPALRARAVPWALRARIMVNVLTVTGAALIAIALVAAKFSLPFDQARAKWQLASDPRSAQGVVEMVSDIKFAIGEQPVHRFDYRFAGPDGKMHFGQSFSRTQRPKEGQAVEVQYAASNPRISHIRGMGMTVTPGWAPMVPLSLGALMMLTGMLWGVGRLRQLRNGKLATARLKTCQVKGRGRDAAELPFEQFKQQYAPSDADAAPARQFMTPWTWAAFAVTVFGALFILAALWIGAQGGNRGIAVFGGFFFVTWLMIGTSAISAGKRGKSSLLDRASVLCSFEFLTPQTETVVARNRAENGAQMASAQSEEPVLYPARRPQKALLLRALPLPVRVGSDGRLELLGGSEIALARVSLLTFLLIGPALFYFLA